MMRLGNLFGTVVALCVISGVAVYGCKHKAEGASSQAEKEPLGLAWGEFKDRPETGPYRDAILLDERDVLLLYDILTKADSKPEDFAQYYVEFRDAKDEFERAKIAPTIKQKLAARAAELQSHQLVAKIAVPIGEYDFKQAGFPLFLKPFGDQHPGLVSHVLYSTLGKNVHGFSYGFAMVFTNQSDTSLFPPLLSMPAARAESFVPDFGTEKSDGTYRYVWAYMLVKPKAAGQGYRAKRYWRSGQYVDNKPWDWAYIQLAVTAVAYTTGVGSDERSPVLSPQSRRVIAITTPSLPALSDGAVAIDVANGTARSFQPSSSSPEPATAVPQGPPCHPCSSQEDFDVAWQKKMKCCPVRGCEGDSGCSGSRVCCRIPMGTLCTDSQRCRDGDRVP